MSVPSTFAGFLLIVNLLCRISLVTASDQDTLRHDGQTRIFWLHVPPTYNQTNDPVSLVIALRYCGQRRNHATPNYLSAEARNAHSTHPFQTR
jgi:poly(3-hydroxybutyrate) depolymerase